MGTGWAPRWGAARGWAQGLAEVQGSVDELWVPRDTTPDTLARAWAWDRPGRALKALERQSQLSLEPKQHVALAAGTAGASEDCAGARHHTGRGGHPQPPELSQPSVRPTASTRAFQRLGHREPWRQLAGHVSIGKDTAADR